VIVVGLTSTLLISWLSFRFYESAFLKLKERWTVRQPTRDGKQPDTNSR